MRRSPTTRSLRRRKTKTKTTPTPPPKTPAGPVDPWPSPSLAGPTQASRACSTPSRGAPAPSSAPWPGRRAMPSTPWSEARRARPPTASDRGCSGWSTPQGSGAARPFPLPRPTRQKGWRWEGPFRRCAAPTSSRSSSTPRRALATGGSWRRRRTLGWPRRSRRPEGRA